MALVACGGCGTPPVAAPTRMSAPDTASWRASRKSLAELRAKWGAEPGTMNLAVRLVSHTTGTDMSGRGVVAVDPPESLRMVLLGPGGLTALDLLVRGEHWRLSIPARDKTFRDGQTSEDQSRYLPVRFLRWWLLTPLQGRLVAAWERDGRSEWVLRDDRSVLDVASLGDRLEVTRRGAATERVVASGGRCGTARYENEDIGLSVEVRCESWRAGRPDPRVFAAEK